MHLDNERFGGFGKRESVRTIHADERRNVKGLSNLCLRSYPIIVHFSERVVDRGKDSGERIVMVEAIKEGNGIEDVSEVSQVRQEEDLAIRQIDAVRFRVRPNAFADW